MFATPGAEAKAAATPRHPFVANQNRLNSASDGVTIVKSGPSCSGRNSDSTPPSTIRVLEYASHSNGWGSNPIGVVTVPFIDYVKDVLPGEWEPGWPPESLKAGAVAAKTYAWYWTNHLGGYYKTASDCFDVTDDVAFQYYAPNTAQPSTSAAVDATWRVAATVGGHIFQASFQGDLGPTQGVAESCGAYVNGTTLSQFGSQSCAAKGEDYQTILHTYYGGLTLSGVQSPGRSTGGLARFGNGAWTFYRSNAAPAPAQHAVAATDEYGTWSGTAATDVPLVGDWQGTGKDSPGLARFANGTWTFYLSNTAPAPGQHTNAATDEYVTWSGTAATDVPLVGDWQGTGKDSPGLARFANGTWTFYLSNTAPAPGQHTNAATDEYVTWSGTAATDVPLVGDWQGTGKDSPGLARFANGTWTFYRSNAAPAPAQHAVAATDEYVTWSGTAATDTPMVGDWQGTGKDSPGLARFSSGTWTFYRSNAAPSPGQHASATTDQYVTWAGTAATDITQTGHWN